jgi:hypothetical protein
MARWPGVLTMPPHQDSSPAHLLPISNGAFSYGSDGFTISEIRRDDPADIRRHYGAPNSSKLEKATRKWIAAQLRHYGIKFKSGARKEELQTVFKDSVAAGQVSILVPLSMGICTYTKLVG